MARKPIPGTDLASRFPAVAEEWDYEKNNPLTPDQVTGKSGKKVWWKCDKGHSWAVAIAHRTNGNNCPYCTGKLPIAGETDFATVCKDLLPEWDYEKNNSVKPQDVLPFSHKKVFWKCEKGHSWEATIADRSRGNGCPYCSGKRPIAGETDFATVCKELLPEWDYEKNDPLKPDEVLPYSSKIVFWKCRRNHSWAANINSRTQKSGCPYCAGELPIAGKTDFATVCKDLLPEWDYEKNKSVEPQDVLPFSHKKVFWKCEKGHSWEATIADRSCGNGCPYCSGKRPIAGETDFATVCKELLPEWDYEKNDPLKPDEVLPYSSKIVFWKCENRHSWKASIYSRTMSTGCPYCSGRIPIVGETDFATVCNELLFEWDYEKNAPLKPEDVTPNSGRKVFWKCKEGHSWEVSIHARAKGNGCPYCAGKLPIVGKTDFATVCKNLLPEWDYVKNAPLEPENVTPNSGKKVFWKCKEGHSWKAAIYHRSKGRGCPYCAGKRPVAGETDFATVCKHLLSEWDYEKNKPLEPEDITSGSGKKVFWKCEKGHSWKAAVYTRVNGNGCPKCRYKRE